MDEATIIRALRQELSEPEMRELARWRRSSPANERQYQEVVSLWQLTVMLQDETRRERRVTGAQLVRMAESVAPCEAGPPPNARGIRVPWAVGLAVAAGLIGIAAGNLLPSRNHKSVPEAPTELITSNGEQATLTLGDGTVVKLAPRSRLKVLNGADQRGVWLEGRAYFAVAKLPGRPFRVLTRAGEATVLGTRFDLRVDADELRVVVAEGRVVLQAAAGRADVGAKQMSGIRNGRPLPVVSVGSMRPLVGWTGKFLAFQETPLRDVAADVHALYGAFIRFVDTSLADRTVTAWFSDRSIDEVMQVVCMVAIVTCTEVDGEFRVSPQ